MKVSALGDAFRFLNPVRAKPDAGGQSGKQGSGQQSQNQQKSNDEPELDEFVVDDDKVDAAMAAFSADLQSQSNGLEISKAGHGPGLRVVLKDGRGATVRQFTGEEFLRLREVVSKEGRVRGKILDQKI